MRLETPLLSFLLKSVTTFILRPDPGSDVLSLISCQNQSGTEAKTLRKSLLRSRRFSAEVQECHKLRDKRRSPVRLRQRRLASELLLLLALATSARERTDFLKGRRTKSECHRTELSEMDVQGVCV